MIAPWIACSPSTRSHREKVNAGPIAPTAARRRGWCRAASRDRHGSPRRRRRRRRSGLHLETKSELLGTRVKRAALTTAARAVNAPASVNTENLTTATSSPASRAATGFEPVAKNPRPAARSKRTPRHRGTSVDADCADHDGIRGLRLSQPLERRRQVLHPLSLLVARAARRAAPPSWPASRRSTGRAAKATSAPFIAPKRRAGSTITIGDRSRPAGTPLAARPAATGTDPRRRSRPKCRSPAQQSPASRRSPR